MEVQVITLPSEVSELAVKVSANKQEEVKTVLQQIFTGTDDWEKQVDAIEVKDINDKMSIELAEVARKNSKQARLSAEKIFDAKREGVQNLKAEFDLEDKLWLKAKQVMQIKFKAIEEKAEWKANFVKRFEAEQKELRTQKRINEVSKYAEINRMVYGEDYEERAQPQTLKELFSNVRKNYFRLYFHYAYFNLVSTWYAQLDVLFSLIVLFPSIAAGTMTLGLLNQIGNVFDKVRESFQYLVSSWKTIIELLSIYKRLKAFEAVLKD